MNPKFPRAVMFSHIMKSTIADARAVDDVTSIREPEATAQEDMKREDGMF